MINQLSNKIELRVLLFLLLFTLPLQLFAQEVKPAIESSPNIQFVQVDDNVQLQVVDWGGTGRALVLIPGLGDVAHVYNDFALKLAKKYHVFGITRRGFGQSSHPEYGYEADRLGDDVLIVIDSLNLEKPILVGHSIGGQELSSVATRFPDRLAALIYIDAAYQYAFDGTGDVEIIHKFANLELESSPQRGALLIRQKITAGIQSYKEIPVRSLALFTQSSDEMLDPSENHILEVIQAFEVGVPNSKVIMVEGADHYIYKSHESLVLQEIDTFIEDLP